MKICHRCGSPWDSEKREPGVKEYCTQCSAYLHCCLNCRFHDRSRPNQCRIPNTETIANRTDANFCDEFEFRETGTAAPAEAGRDAARQHLASLLGGQPPDRPPAAGELLGDGQERRPRNFDELFRE